MGRDAEKLDRYNRGRECRETERAIKRKSESEEREGDGEKRSEGRDGEKRGEERKEEKEGVDGEKREAKLKGETRSNKGRRKGNEGCLTSVILA